MMAKLFLIIICVCTACVHLAWAQMARKGAEQSPHVWSNLEFRQNHRHETVQLIPQDVVAKTVDNIAISDLDYEIRKNPMEISDLNELDIDPQQKLVNIETNPLQPRHKRNAGHNHHEINHIEMNHNTERFIEKIFKQFSNSHDTMNLIEFEQMMVHLGLDRLIEDKHFNTVNSNSDGNSNMDANHSHDAHSNETVSIHM